VVSVRPIVRLFEQFGQTVLSHQQFPTSAPRDVHVGGIITGCVCVRVCVCVFESASILSYIGVVELFK
jgi:hypothetical protein